jgi:serine/threonine protein phosphatase 1
MSMTSEVMARQRRWPGKALKRRRESAYRVPAGTRVYAVGDIHGRADLLAKMHDLIRADAEGCRAKRKVVVYLGDYVDRGPRSREVIEMLAGGALEDFEPIFLKGNHEDYMLKFLAGSVEGIGWLYNGGEETLASYGVDPGLSPQLGHERLERMRRALDAALPETHRRFLDTLKLHHAEGGYLFVHAGVKPEIDIAEQSEEDLLWIREEFLHSGADHHARVVHGHTIAWSPEVRDNRIGIDTGAFMSGVLTCLVIEGARTRFLATKG